MNADSIEALERAALAGDWGASARLGLNYLVGRRVAADPVRGIALIDQAARSGDALGAYLAATIASTLQILATGPSGDAIDGLDWTEMREAINLDAWFTPPEPRLLRETPRIQVTEQFVPTAVCQWLIERVRGRLSRATIYDKATGGTTEDGRRTNSQCDLDIEIGGVLTFVLRGRISAATGRPDAAMEVPKVLHYRPGETFAEHFDYLNPDEPAYARELAVRGQRVQTFLIYLNDDFSGGETHFPELGLSHAGAAGEALVFSNVDPNGKPDTATRHAGLPPTEGEKWLFSQWIREFPRD
jgi:hypothetical protein